MLEQKNIPTLYTNLTQLLLDLKIYSRVASVPQLSIEEQKENLYKEFQKQRPMPTMEMERYKLSNIVSSDYKVTYDKELELQEFENLMEFDSDAKELPVFEPEFIPDEVVKLFSYDNKVKDSDRQAIIDRYDLSTGQEYQGNAEQKFGTLEQSQTVITEDEIDDLFTNEDSSLAPISEGNKQHELSFEVPFIENFDVVSEAKEQQKALFEDTEEEVVLDTEELEEETIEEDIEEEIIDDSEEEILDDDSEEEIIDDSEEIEEEIPLDESEGVEEEILDDSEEEIIDDSEEEVFEDEEEVIEDDSEEEIIDDEEEIIDDEEEIVEDEEEVVFDDTEEEIVEDEEIEEEIIEEKPIVQPKPQPQPQPQPQPVVNTPDDEEEEIIDDDEEEVFDDSEEEIIEDEEEEIIDDSEEEIIEDEEEEIIDDSEEEEIIDDEEEITFDESEEVEEEEEIVEDDEEEIVFDEPKPQIQQNKVAKDQSLQISAKPSHQEVEIKPKVQAKSPPVVDIDTSDVDINFTSEQVGVSQTQKVAVQQPVVQQKPTEERPTDLRQFIRQHPRCEYSEALKYFSEKEIKKAIISGKIIKKGNTLRI